MKKILFLNCILCIIGINGITQNKTIDSLKLVLKNAKHDTTRCNILSALVEKSSEEEWPVFNNQYLGLTEGLLKSTQKSKLETKTIKRHYADALNNAALNFGNKGDIQNELKYYLMSLKINEEINNKKGMGQNFNHIGVMYKERGDVLTAMEYLKKGLKINEEIRDKHGIAMAFNYIASLYSDQGEITKALEYFYKSLNLRQEIKDKAGIAITLNDISYLYGLQGEKQKELEIMRNSLEIRQEIQDKSGETAALLNMGSIYFSQDSITRALIYYHNALNLAQEIGNKSLISDVLMCLGKTFYEQDSTVKSIKYLNDAKKIKVELQDRNGQAFILFYTGEVYLKQKKYPNAIDCLSKGLAISREVGYPLTIRENARMLSVAYKAMGNYEKALENYVLYIQMRDSIVNDKNKKASIKSQYKYEYEKKAAADSIKVAEENKIVAVQLKQEKTQRFALYGGLALVLVFAGFMFNRFRVTQKQKNIIELKEKETQQQNEIITIQKHLVEEKHKEITDSINYAERIQRSFLATEKQLSENLNNYFVFFKPKDVVSGDFYWSAKLSNGNFALATADSTGHGVPGAIMSLLNVTSLEKAIEHYINPADILNHTRQTIIERLKKDGSEEGGKDGMDCSLLVFESPSLEERDGRVRLHIAAANNPVWIIRSNSPFEGGVRRTGDVELIEIKPDKMPVGKSDKQDQSYTTHTLELQKGDTIYTLTDGFPDQFGGDKGKKFMSKKLKELLLANVDLPITHQKELLETTFKNWVGDLEQVDDVTVIGIRI